MPVFALYDHALVVVVHRRRVCEYADQRSRHATRYGLTALVGVVVERLVKEPRVVDEELDALFLEQKSAFDWHEGMLIEGVDTEDGGRYELVCEQWQEGERFVHESEVVVLATGYQRPDLTFRVPVEDRIARDSKGRPKVTEDYRLDADGLPGEIFVQNAELHTHGINAPDLGLGCYRNAVISNSLLDDEVYPVGRGSTFQDFAAHTFAENRGARSLETSTPKTG